MMDIKPVARTQPLKKIEESLQKDGKQKQRRRKPSREDNPARSDGKHHRVDEYA